MQGRDGGGGGGDKDDDLTLSWYQYTTGGWCGDSNGGEVGGRDWRLVGRGGLVGWRGETSEEEGRGGQFLQ